MTPECRENCKDFLVKEKRLTNTQASRILRASRNTKYYKKKMVKKDLFVKQAIDEVIGNSRKGRNKVIFMVQRAYPELGSSKIRRVYERYGYSLTRKMKRRIVHNPSNPIQIPMKGNDEWAIDFMSDALTNGRKLRTLNVIDHYNRKCLGLLIRHNFPAVRVIEALERIIEEHGKPQMIRTDNGPEFRSKRFQLWLQNNHISWSAIPNGRPDQNAIIERFNRTYREDVLNAHLFETIDDAQQITDSWKSYYNDVRPHQSLNNQTPTTYAA